MTRRPLPRLDCDMAIPPAKDGCQRELIMLQARDHHFARWELRCAFFCSVLLCSPVHSSRTRGFQFYIHSGPASCPLRHPRSNCEELRGRDITIETSPRQTGHDPTGRELDATSSYHSSLLTSGRGRLCEENTQTQGSPTCRLQPALRVRV